MIYQLVYDVFFLCARRMKKKKENGRSSSILLKKVSERIEWYYNIWIKKCYEKNNLKSIGINTTPRREKIIVSLTSYPKRIETTWLAIETLLRQTVKPDKIILWLADTQFESLEKIPRELREQQKRGLTIRFCDDLKSHKKYFYTMQEYKNKKVPEIGYLFQKAFWHQGYAAETAVACKEYAFNVLNIDEVYSIIRDNNITSQNVAKKNGMTIKDEFVKHYYGMDMLHYVFSVKK
jgi:RimJ/RimL family protein N-acetyltransferase